MQDFVFGSPTRSKPEKRLDAKTNVTSVRLLPGEHYVTALPREMLVTILGSCISACIRDPKIGVGGMNHFLLPLKKGEDTEGSSWGKADDLMRYGNFAMEKLINEVLSRGGKRDRLEIKLFGGSNVLKTFTAVGSNNCKFVMDYLATEGLRVFSKDIGGSLPRRIHYFPDTGKVMRIFIREGQQENYKRLVQREEVFAQTVVEKPKEDDIELFD